jgi:hypothetical protein
MREQSRLNKEKLELRKKRAGGLLEKELRGLGVIFGDDSSL